jgi:hypothetical protein
MSSFRSRALGRAADCPDSSFPAICLCLPERLALLIRRI